MMALSENIESMLAIDIGSVNTRAFLFDITDGVYRFVASGIAPTTASKAFENDIEIGVTQAVEHLSEITGRKYYSEDRQLIIPRQPDGSGVDSLLSTLSAGPVVSMIVVGLLSDVSLESAQRLAASTYGRIIESIGLADQRSADMQIDTIIRAKPDLVIVAGGMEDGASRSVMNLLEIVGLACHLLPMDSRPQVIYAGNQALADKVKTLMEPLTTTYVTNNIRPSFLVEDLAPAQETLSNAIIQLRRSQIKGLDEISREADKKTELSSTAYGRIIRFLSRAYEPGKGVLGVDIGASTTTIAGASNEELSLYLATSLGMGESIKGIQSKDQINELMNWIPLVISQEYVQEYICNKFYHPGSVPVSLEDLSIEQAVARQILRKALTQATQKYPAIGFNPATGLVPSFEPILASGAIFTQAPTYGQVMMMLLDGILPTGITTFVLDQNNLGSVLGSAASVLPMLPVQVLESNSFLNLGTVISPVSQARIGATILRLNLVNNDGTEDSYEIKQGSLTVLPVQKGQKARIYIEPLHNTDLGIRQSGSRLSLNIVGGAMGAVIDARGRPLVFPADVSRRREWIKKWLWTLGG
jgi:hypothetical protein